MASVKTTTAPAPPRTGAPPDRSRSGALKPAAAVWARTAFVGHTFRAMVTTPFSWRGEFADQAWMMLKRVWIPALIVGFVFGYEATGIQLMSIVEVFGDISRAGRIVHTANFREQAIWNTGLVVAGVLGTAITADLGARKVRDELAALEVMGVDVIRKLVVPRVLAITLLTPIASTLVIIGEYYGDFPAFKQFGGDVNVFAQAARAFNPVDAFIYPVRSLVLGLILGIVSAYEGINASGGARGVGRAVNRAVVIGFALVLVWDWASTSVYVTLFNAETLV